MAAKCGFFLPTDLEVSDIPWADLLPPGKRRSLNMHLAAAEKDESIRFFDLDQNAGQKGDSAGPILGCLFTHGLLWSVKLQRPLLTDGRFLSLGVPLPPYASEYTCPVADILMDTDAWSASNLLTLSGNAIHCHVLSTWVAYCYSNLVPLDATVSFGVQGTSVGLAIQAEGSSVSLEPIIEADDDIE